MRVYFGVVALLLLAALACGTEEPSPTETPTQMPEASPTPTHIPIPTALPTPLAPTPTPSPTPTLVSQASPTATPIAIPTPQDEITIPDSFQTVINRTFGFQLRYPPDWNLVTQVAPPTMVLIGNPDGSPPVVQVSLFYDTAIVTPDAAVDSLLPNLFSRPGFRTLDESAVNLNDGSTGFQTTYQWRSDQGEEQGILFATVRGTQNFFIRAEAPKDDLEASMDDLQALIASFQLNEPRPLDIPRQEALTLYFDDGPLLLDPAIAHESQSIQYIMQVFSGLISFNEDLVLVPELASEWSISEDGTVYTFTIRDGAKFHGGRPVTADDVKSSWERAWELAASPGLPSTTVGTYLDDVVGIEEFTSGDAEEISGIQVIDQNTLQVTIDDAKSYFLSKLSHPVAFVVDQNQIEDSQGSDTPWWVEPNGTGPFKLISWEPRRVMVLQANDEFYGGAPPVPHLVYRLYGGVPRLMYETGEIDVARVFADELPQVNSPDYPLAGELVETSELSVHYIGMSSDRPPFDDPLVRKAFLLSADREALVEDILGESVDLAKGFLPPGLPGYNPEIAAIPFDPYEARRLIEQSSYGGVEALPDIVYTASGVAQPSIIVSQLIQMWRLNLGVEVGVQLVQPDAYFYVLDEIDKNLFTYGWIADYPDPQNFLDVLFHSSTENNQGGYNNAEVDSLLEQARVEQNPSQRTALYHQAEAMLVDDAAAIPLYHGRSQMLVKPYVNDLLFTPFGMLDLRGTSLDR